MDPFKNEQKSATFINESGLCSVMLQSKLHLAKAVVMYYISSSLLQGCQSHINAFVTPVEPMNMLSKGSNE